MKTEQNIEIIRQCYTAFQRGDLPGIMEFIAERGFERWSLMSYSSKRAPWHMNLTQKSEIPSYFAALLGAVEPIRFEPSCFAATGDYVYTTTHHEYKVRKNGKTLIFRDVLHRFKLVDSKIVEVVINEDTALTLETLG